MLAFPDLIFKPPIVMDCNNYVGKEEQGGGLAVVEYGSWRCGNGRVLAEHIKLIGNNQLGLREITSS